MNRAFERLITRNLLVDRKYDDDEGENKEEMPLEVSKLSLTQTHDMYAKK